MSWVRIKGLESNKLLQTNNQLYTEPDPWQLECSPSLRDGDITYYRRENNKPYVLISKGWNTKGENNKLLWETTYFKWVDEEGEGYGNLQ